MSLTFYIVDVFAQSKYAGNQLAVVRKAGALSGDEMQTIAKEMNYSETTFILSDEERDGGYDVRIFTPANELPFAGHPTLGTAFVIQREIMRKPVETVTLNLGVGKIPVTFEYEQKGKSLLWMKQVEPTFGSTLDAEALSQVLNLDETQIEHRFPVQEVSTGVPTIVVPLKNIDALKQARIDRDRYFSFVEKTDGKGILIFCPEARNRENDVSVRFFADYYGVPEDPATGSANGCLAGYLVKHRFFGKDQIDVRVEQGYEIGRPSLLLLRAGEKEGSIEVNVGGRVVMVAEGKLV